MLESEAVQKLSAFLAKSKQQVVAQAQQAISNVVQQVAQLKEALSAKRLAETVDKFKDMIKEPPVVVTDFDREHKRLGAFRKMTLKERIDEYVDNVKTFAQKLAESTQKPPPDEVTDFDRRRAKKFADQEAQEKKEKEEAERIKRFKKLAARLERGGLTARAGRGGGSGGGGVVDDDNADLLEEMVTGTSPTAGKSSPFSTLALLKPNAGAAAAAKAEELDFDSKYGAAALARARAREQEQEKQRTGKTLVVLDIWRGEAFRHRLLQAVDGAKSSLVQLQHDAKATADTIRVEKVRWLARGAPVQVTERLCELTRRRRWRCFQS